MPRLTRIYTRTGDDGTTALGTGERVAKTSIRVAACGAIDELNSQLGVVLASGLLAELDEPLRTVQNELFHAGADLCVPEQDKGAHPGPRIDARHVERLETLMDRLNEALPALENFVLPGGAPAAAQLHVARAVCRRAERDVARLTETEPVNPQILRYLNRLSDALFVMARRQNHAAGVPEPSWDSRA